MNTLYKLSKNLHKTFLTTIPKRNYTRWTHRNPVRILDSEEHEEAETKIHPVDAKTQFQQEIKIKWRNQVDQPEQPKVLEREQRPKKPFEQFPTRKKATTDMLQTVIDAEGNFIYTKLANNDSRAGSLLTTIKTQKEKTKKDLILLEGKTLIKDALLAGCALKYLLFSRKDDVQILVPHLPKAGALLYKMPYREMQMWSDLQTCPGIMGLFRTPSVSEYEVTNPIPLTIYCDNIREPGNLGSILRVSAAVGCKKVILSKGCTYLWDTKVTRGSAGAHFRVQINTRKELQDVRNELQEKQNVRLFVADSNLVNSWAEESTKLEEVISNVPVVPYYSVDFTAGENILIVGGETSGLSKEVYELAEEFNGIRLNIPMKNEVDSLNSATALGILAFEITKQLATKFN